MSTVKERFENPTPHMNAAWHTNQNSGLLPNDGERYTKPRRRHPKWKE